MTTVIVVAVSLFAFFFFGLMWAQRSRDAGRQAMRRRGRLLVIVCWGTLGLALAIDGAITGKADTALLGGVLAAMNALLWWRLYRRVP